jgi:hypothetical protein
MEPLAIMLVFVAAAAVYAGVTGQDVMGQVREALGGPPAKPRKPSPFQQNVGGAETAASSTATDPTGPVGPQGPQNLAGSTAPAGSALTETSPHGAIPAKPKGTVPDAAQLDLVSIGQGSHKLTRAAAASFAAVEQAVGRQVRVTDSYRTHAQEQDLARRKPGFGVPGYSLHEVGLAVDIVDMTAADIVQAFNAEGWVRWNPTGEPWHWSYWLRG